MELRQLEAFVVVATELHFRNAAEKLGISQATLSELIRRLEREFAIALFTRTTRRVSLTAAGEELLGRAKVVLDEAAAAKTAVQRVAAGETGAVRMAITPPVAPVLAQHLHDAARRHLPGVTVQVRRMWLPNLTQALADGAIDVAITCGQMPATPGVVNAVFCSEPLLVGLRPEHALAAGDSVMLADLAQEPLGIPNDALFPAWAMAQAQALNDAGVSPTTVVLDATDLSAAGWTSQTAAAWVFLTASLGLPADTAARPISPPLHVPFTLQWIPERAPTAAVGRFVRLALTLDVPPGWRLEPGHLRHRA